MLAALARKQQEVEPSSLYSSVSSTEWSAGPAPYPYHSNAPSTPMNQNSPYPMMDSMYANPKIEPPSQPPHLPSPLPRLHKQPSQDGYHGQLSNPGLSSRIHWSASQFHQHPQSRPPVPSYMNQGPPPHLQGSQQLSRRMPWYSPQLNPALQYDTDMQFPYN